MSRGKQPSFQFYMGDWMKDGALGMCEPASRGIWIDLLCTMQIEGTGRLTGTFKALARVSRCTADECRAALEDLRTNGAAEVHRSDCPAIDEGECTCLSRKCPGKCPTEKGPFGHFCPTDCPAEVTVISRRLDKEHKSREYNRLRKQRQRGVDGCPEDVTPSRARSSSTSVKRSSLENEGYESPPARPPARAPSREARSPVVPGEADPRPPPIDLPPDDFVPTSVAQWRQWLVNERGWAFDRTAGVSATEMLGKWVEAKVAIGEARLAAESAHAVNPTPSSPCWYREFVQDAVRLRGKEQSREARTHHRPGRPLSAVERTQQALGTYWPDRSGDGPGDANAGQGLVIDTRAIPD